jgi:hypothetical protein
MSSGLPVADLYLRAWILALALGLDCRPGLRPLIAAQSSGNPDGEAGRWPSGISCAYALLGECDAAIMEGSGPPIPGARIPENHGIDAPPEKDEEL